MNMMTRKKKKFLFNVFGVAAVTLWLIMMGMVVKKSLFKAQTEGPNSGELVGKIDAPHRDWSEIYLKDKKVGYASNAVKPSEEGYFIQ